MLNITSRTLRFYEEKSLIKSKKSTSNRRQYNIDDIELIKKILVLRSLGLSVNKIKEIQKGDSDLKQAIIQHKAEIIAKIVKRSKEIQLLDDALNTLEHDGDIFCVDSCAANDFIQNEKVNFILKNFILGEYEVVFNRFSETLQSYMPLSAFKRIVADALSPLGNFISLECVKKDKTEKKVFYGYLKYEKLGLCIKLVMFEDKIHGIWLTYYEI